MKKQRYAILINQGKARRNPLVYKFGKTNEIELHLTPGKAAVLFSQGKVRMAKDLLTDQDFLCADAIKKAMLIHLISYGKPLDIRDLQLEKDGVRQSVLQRKRNDKPLVYSMINQSLDYPLPAAWKTKDVLETMLSFPKSAYDGRMNAVVSLLIAKTQQYESLQSMFLWMSMNGFYNYIAEQIDKKAENKIGNGEQKKQNAMAYVLGMPETRDAKKDDKQVIMKKSFSIFPKLDTTPEELYEAVKRHADVPFVDHLNKLLDDYNVKIDPMRFMTIWLPYQIRCNYFHSNQTMPLFLYEQEIPLCALHYTNYFVERFLEEQLPAWLTKKELSDEERQTMYERYIQGVK